MLSQVEPNIPIPEPIRGGRGRPPSPVLARMRELEIGESFCVDTWEERQVIRSVQSKQHPKKFSVRKIPHEGWRVWRVE
jgi:hypothetical protein